jgi:hypothetical protein
MNATKNANGRKQDVLLETDDVVVFSPNSEKGVLVSTYADSENKESIDKNGLFSAKVAFQKGLTNRTRDYLNDIVFFRPSDTCMKNNGSICYQIRVDPTKTYVYDQEYHAQKGTTNGEPKRLLSDYLNIISQIPVNGYVYWKHFNDYKIEKYPIKPEHNDYSKIDAHRWFEVRVQIDNIPPSWFVPQSGGKSRKTMKRGSVNVTKPVFTKTNRVYVGKDGIKRFVYTKSGDYFVLRIVNIQGIKKRKYVRIHI